jgi:hypothetical protein
MGACDISCERCKALSVLPQQKPASGLWQCAMHTRTASCWRQAVCTLRPDSSAASSAGLSGAANRRRAWSSSRRSCWLSRSSCARRCAGWQHTQQIVQGLLLVRESRCLQLRALTGIQQHVVLASLAAGSAHLCCATSSARLAAAARSPGWRCRRHRIPACACMQSTAECQKQVP